MKKYLFMISGWFGSTILGKVSFALLGPILFVILLPIFLCSPLYIIFYDLYHEIKEDFFNIRSLDQAISLIINLLIRLACLWLVIGPFIWVIFLKN